MHFSTEDPAWWQAVSRDNCSSSGQTLKVIFLPTLGIFKSLIFLLSIWAHSAAEKKKKYITGQVPGDTLKEVLLN